MPVALIASLAVTVLAVLGALILAAKLATARNERDDLREEIADLKADRRKLLKENVGYRAEKAKRMAPLIKANADRKAKAKNGATA